MDGKKPGYFNQEGFLDMCEMDLPEIGLNNAESILFYEECKEKLHKQFVRKWESSI